MAEMVCAIPKRKFFTQKSSSLSPAEGNWQRISESRSQPRQFTDILKIKKLSVENELQKLGYVFKREVWVPHKLTEYNLAQRVSICDSLLKPFVILMKI